MKVFVADDSSQHQGGFSFTIPGEMVHLPPMTCDCPGCECDQAMGGFVSHKATTKFVVRDLDLTPAEYIDLFIDTHRKGGWIVEPSDLEWAIGFAREHMDLAERLPVETPLSIIGGILQVQESDQ